MSQNYYLIGTKYKQSDGYYSDVFPLMVNKNAVSTGFAWEHNLSLYYGKSHNDIIKYLQSKNEESKSYSTLKYFLNLNSGDLIAIKGSGSPVGNSPRLTIIGYAVVCERNGQIYSYDSKDLGHLINVDFLETNIYKEYKLGYGKTVHKLENQQHIEKIFNGYYKIASEFDQTKRTSSKKKNTRSQKITINKTYITNALHNKIQEEFKDYLVKKYGEKNVKMEEDWIDIKVIQPDKITFYEIKPYTSVMQCLREALGQIIEYSWTGNNYNKKLNLVIVGLSKPLKAEIGYLKYLQSKIKLELSYFPFAAKYL